MATGCVEGSGRTMALGGATSKTMAAGGSGSRTDGLAGGRRKGRRSSSSHGIWMVFRCFQATFEAILPGFRRITWVPVHTRL